ncbi:hypothetical protein B296_00004020, partial [Ensete ventricosum]
FHKKTRQSQTLRKVEFQSVLYALSQNFKILVIPNVLTHGNSYEHDFAKKHDGHKHHAKSHAKSSFNQFFMYCLRIFTSYSQRISPWEFVRA